MTLCFQWNIISAYRSVYFPKKHERWTMIYLIKPSVAQNIKVDNLELKC